MMKHRHKGDFELSDEAVELAEELDLGEVLNSFPVQRKAAMNGSYKDTGTWLHQFEHGIVLMEYKVEPTAARFDQITAVYQSTLHQFVNGIYYQSHHSFSIVSTADDLVAEGEYFDSSITGRSAARGDPAIVDYIRQVAVDVSRAKMPGALADLAAGRELQFGNFTLTSAGLRLAGDDVVPWSQIQPLQYKDGAACLLRVGERQPAAATVTGRIPNLPLLEALTRHLRATAQVSHRSAEA
jgi:hypothetical protein